MAINWNEVKVGETEICRGGFHNRKVMCMCDPWVWLYDQTSAPSTYHKDDLHTWAVYNPWEDVSDECSINEWGRVEHKGEIIDFKPNVYKRSEKGLRVWKRKEG